MCFSAQCRAVGAGGVGLGARVGVTCDETGHKGLGNPSLFVYFIVGIVDNPPVMGK